MTVKEALISVVAIKFDQSDVELNKVFIDRGLDGESIYDRSKSQLVDLASVDVLITLLGLNSVSEGDMSISYDREGIKTRLLFLAKKHKLTSIIEAIEPRPKVGSVRRM